MTEIIESVEAMLRDGTNGQAVLKTMPKRPLAEQERVWSEGLQRIADRLARAANRAAQTVVERVADGLANLRPR